MNSSMPIEYYIACSPVEIGVHADDADGKFTVVLSSRTKPFRDVDFNAEVLRGTCNMFI